MKIRYLGKLYNTDKLDTLLEEKNEHCYYGNLYSFIADDGKKIYFKYSKFTNFDNIAYLEYWDDMTRQYGSKELKSGVVLLEEYCAIQNDNKQF
jgi:hypothetical protein